MFIGNGKRAQTIVNITMDELYKIILERVQYFSESRDDPDALCQNICCEIEKKMGIYPNVHKVERN